MAKKVYSSRPGHVIASFQLTEQADRGHNNCFSNLFVLNMFSRNIKTNSDASMSSAITI